MNLYKEIIKQGFFAILKNKILIIFGLFAAVFNNFEIYNLLSRDRAPSPISSIFLSIWNAIKFSKIKETFLQSPIDSLLFFISMLIFLAFAVLLIWLAINSQITIIHGIDQISKKAVINIRNALILAKSNFFKIFGLNIIGKAGLFILAFLINVPLLALDILKNTPTVTLSKCAYVVFFVIFILASSIIFFLIIYAVNYVLLQDKSLKTSLSLGWKLFKTNWLITIEMSVVLIFINILVYIVSSLIINGLLFLMLFLYSSEITLLGYSFIFLLFIILIFVMIIFIGGLTAFHLACWTLLFKKLQSKKYLSKIESVLTK